MNRASLAVVAASVLLLTACVPTLSDDDAPPPPTPKPVETVVADEPDEPDDVLFTVTAGTTDDVGTPVTVTLTAHAPQSWDAPGRAAVKDDFLSLCGALGGGSVWDPEATASDATLGAYGSTLMVIDVVSTPAGLSLEPIDLLAGSFYYQQVASGDVTPVTEIEGCTAGNRLTQTGTVRAITDYESGSAAGDLDQWIAGSYGFTATFGTSTTFTSCDVELTPLFATYDLGEIEGWDAAQATDTACWIGYQGE